MPDRWLDLATNQLVLPKGCNQGIPVPRIVERRTTSTPGAATLAQCRSEHFPISALLLRTGHPSNAGIGLDPLLELVVDLNHSVSDLVNLVALPGDWQQHLAALAPTGTSSDVQARMTL